MESCRSSAEESHGWVGITSCGAAMNQMNTIRPPVARTPRELRRDMLRANRFLGIHQAWWGGGLAPIVLYLFHSFGGGSGQWWWPLLAFLLAWTAVELCFLPRRLVIRQLACEESRAEVVRLALRHGVALRDVMAYRQR